MRTSVSVSGQEQSMTANTDAMLSDAARLCVSLWIQTQQWAKGCFRHVCAPSKLLQLFVQQCFLKNSTALPVEVCADFYARAAAGYAVWWS
jgi:hypothetical protein